jgi:hypothetical protein
MCATNRVKQTRRHEVSAAIAGLLCLVLTMSGRAASPEDQALQLERRLLALAPTLGPPPEKSPDAVPQPVQAILATGDWQFSLKFASQIGNEQSRVNTLVAILNKARELLDRPQAHAVLDQVLNAAGKVGSDTGKARVLAAGAAAAVTLGDPAKARDLLTRARHATGRISEESSKASVLGSLAETAGKVGDGAQGSTLLNQALDAADRIAADSTKALALTQLAQVAATLGDTEQGRGLLVGALQAADQMDDDLARARVLGVVAQGAARLGDPAQGRVVLESIIGVTDNVASDLGKARVLASVSGAAADLRDPARVARCSRRSSRLRTRSAVNSPRTAGSWSHWSKPESSWETPRGFETWRSMPCARPRLWVATLAESGYSRALPGLAQS